MATTTQQVGLRGLHSGLLPPRKELVLEIQVNKLINEFLFPRSASSHDKNETLQLKENTLQTMQPEDSCAIDVKANVVCDAVSMAHLRNPNEPGKEALLNMQSSHVEDNAIREALNTASVSNLCESVYTQQQETLAMEFVHGVQDPTCEARPLSHAKGEAHRPHLSRLGTFPCANNSEHAPNTHTVLMVNPEVRFSVKKPPRPPKLPKSSTPNQLPQQLGRCSSDTSALFLSVRRTKLHRKRKAVATSPSNPSASTWALLCTFCFMVLMLAQGFWPKGGNHVPPAVDGSITSSPTGANMKSSMLVTSQKVKTQDGQAIVESGYHAREIVQGPRLMEPNHQEPDTFGNAAN